MSYQFKGVKQVLKGTYDKLSTAEKKGHIYFVRETSSSTGGDIYFGSRHYGHYNATELSELEKSIKNLLGTGVTTTNTVTAQLTALTAKFSDYLPLSGGTIKKYGELTFDDYSQLVIPTTAEFYYQGYNLGALFGEKSNVGHKHTTDDITGGTLNIARIPTGTSANQVALGNHTHAGKYVEVVSGGDNISATKSTTNPLKYTVAHTGAGTKVKTAGKSTDNTEVNLSWGDTLMIPSYLEFDKNGHVITGTTNTTRFVMPSKKQLTIREDDINYAIDSYGGTKITDEAIIDETSANRFAFLKAEGLTDYISTDNGKTWVEQTYDNNSKKTRLKSIFGEGYKTADKKISGNNSYRIVIDTYSAGIYTSLHKIAIFINEGTSGGTITIEKATNASPNNWETVAKINSENENVNSPVRCGWNIFNFYAFDTYGTDTTQYQYIRFTFNGQCPGRILAFGGLGWSTPSVMAKTGHLYSYDSNQVATFPDKIYAKGFACKTGDAGQFLKGDGSLDGHNYLIDETGARRYKGILIFDKENLKVGDSDPNKFVKGDGSLDDNTYATETWVNQQGFSKTDSSTSESGHYLPTTSASTISAGSGKYISGINVDSKKHVISVATGTLPTNTDTHYEAKNIVGASATAKTNAIATNGNVSLNLIENNAVRSHNIIKGANGVTVTSDSAGTITVSGTTYAATTHKHNASDITGGTIDIARIPSITLAKLPTGTTTSTVALGAHTHTIANVTNLQTSLDSKINIGSENDAAGVKSYYGLKKDIAAAVTSVYKVQGSKDNYSELPTTGNTKGDVWNVVNANGDTPAGTNYVWDGDKWDALGGTIDLSSYSKTDHKHAAADVTGGTFNIARIPTGTSSTTVALGNHNHDAVYSKTGHTHAISEVTNLQDTLSGKAPNNHAVTATTYGVGTAANYGHNKIVSGDVSTITAVTNGNAAASFHNHDGAYIKKGTSATQFVKGDGSFDTNTYATQTWVTNKGYKTTDSATTEGGHYSPATEATGNTKTAETGKYISSIKLDSKKHVVGINTSALPINTDSATTMEGHYTPSTSASTISAGSGKYISGINVDSKKHIISVATGTLPNNTDSATTESGHYTPSKEVANKAITADKNAFISKIALDSKNHIISAATKTIKAGQDMIISEEGSDIVLDVNSHLIAIEVGNSKDSYENQVATNGNVHLNLIDNTEIVTSHIIKGTGATTVTSDVDGNITIDSNLRKTLYNPIKGVLITLSLTKKDGAMIQVHIDGNNYSGGDYYKVINTDIVFYNFLSSNGPQLQANTSQVINYGANLGDVYAFYDGNDNICLWVNGTLTASSYKTFGAYAWRNMKDTENLVSSIVDADLPTTGITGQIQITNIVNATLTDTHYSAKNVICASTTGKTNATATNGNVTLNLIENNTVRSHHKITGSGSATVTADTSGNITIYADKNTDTHYEAKNIVTSSATGKTTAAATNGNVRLNLIENNNVKSTTLIKGSGATSVVSDSAGTITISSSNTTYKAGTGISIDSANTINCTLDTSLYTIITDFPTSNISTNKIYLKQSKTTGNTNIYTEYIYVNSKWEKLGEYKATVDLSPYAKKANINGAGIATVSVSGDNITINVPNTNTDTHYTSTNVIAASATGKTNAVATNGNVWLNHIENNAITSTNNIKGVNGVTVTSDSAGTITISGTTYASTTHKHTAADVTGGTFDIARIPTGTSATSVALGNHNHDTAYSKTGHTHAISEVTSLQDTLIKKAPNNHAVSATTYGVGTTANYGHNKIVSGDVSTITAITNGNSAASFHNHDGAYAKSSHKHVASDITGGTFDIARIPSITLAKLPTGTTATTVALGNHTHSNYLTSDALSEYVKGNGNLGDEGRLIYLKDGELILGDTFYNTFSSFNGVPSRWENYTFSSFYDVSNTASEVAKITNASGKYIGNGLRTINYNPISNLDHNSQLGFSFDYPLLLWRKTVQSGDAWSWDNWKIAQAMPFCLYDTTTNATGFGGKQFSNYVNSGEIRFPFMYMEGTTHFSKSLDYWANTMMMNEFNNADSGVNPYTSMFGVSSNLVTPKAFIGAGKNTEQGKWNLLQLVTENYTGDVTIEGAFTQSKGDFTVDGRATMNGNVTMTRSSEIYGNLTVKGQIGSAKGFFETSDERLKTFGNDIDVDFEKISKLKKAYFVFNDDKDKKQHIGVSAQEVKEIYPELVSEGENGYLTVDYAKLSVIALSAVDKLNNELSEIKSMLKELLNKK